ncbi:hypothetical protein PRZ48_001458 [Zasmidium cellare]|uniref:NACHT domain-containing protein n=1 Tax=Zasmidium cellare TaxID=395010 RepID=A0ABR0F2N1_ZASCE|nr:hypothetical protein PRZ48_001458 [Zasmidium cellare]
MPGSASGDTLTAFISGPLDVSTAYFTRYYRSRIDDAISSGHKFVIGPLSGIDALALEYLLSRNVESSRIKIYMAGFEIASRPTFVAEMKRRLGDDGVVEAKKGDGTDALTTWDRDAAMTRDSDYDILRFRTEAEQKSIFGDRWGPRVSNTERNWRRRKGEDMEDMNVEYVSHVDNQDMKPRKTLLWSRKRREDKHTTTQCDGFCDAHRDVYTSVKLQGYMYASESMVRVASRLPCSPGALQNLDSWDNVWAFHVADLFVLGLFRTRPPYLPLQDRGDPDAAICNAARKASHMRLKQANNGSKSSQHNAPDSLSDIVKDLRHLEPWLESLKDSAQHNQGDPARFERVSHAVENCYHVCQSFRLQLKTWSKPDTDGELTIRKRFTIGLFNQDRIKEFRTIVSECKGTLLLALVAENFINPPKDETLLQLMRRSEELLKEQSREISARLQELQQAEPRKDQELHSMMQENHEETRESLARMAERMQNSETQQRSDSALGIEELRRLFSVTQALKDDYARVSEFLVEQAPNTGSLAKWSDQLRMIPDIHTIRQDLARSRVPPFVWIRGDTGKGKTMLSAYLLHQLDALQRQQANTHVIYFFCDKREEKRKSAAAVLRSLLWQLTMKRDLSECIEAHLKTRKSPPLPSDHEDLWPLFAALMHDGKCGKVYCIIDGLDELADGEDLWLAKTLLGHRSPAASEPHLNVFRVLVVSRSIPGFQERDPSQLLCLDTEFKDCVDADIARVAGARLATIPGWKDSPVDYRDKVREELMQKTRGSFVPVGMMIDIILARQYDEWLTTIRSLPDGMNNLYSSTLLGITGEERSTSPEVLRWIVMAFRPLSLKELANAIGGDVDDIAIRTTVERLGSLLTIQDETVTLSHSSFRDYLLSTEGDRSTSLAAFDSDEKQHVECFRFDPQQAHLEISQKSHLQHRALESKDDWEGAPLLQYAVFNWFHHARESGVGGKEIFESTKFVLSKASSLRQNWWTTYVRERPGQAWEQGKRLSPLHIACRFGITEWVRAILSEVDTNALKMVVNDPDVNGVTPLAWAAIEGHASVVEVLLEYEADIEASTELYSRGGLSPLSPRSMTSYLGEIKAGSTEGMWRAHHTPLFRAAYKGHVSVVKLLLDRGANVHARGWANCTPMHAVGVGGNVEVLNVLLEHGGDQDVDAELKKLHTTPLLYAVEHGHREVASILLDHGADITKRQAFFKATVLHFAGARSPDASTVELLVTRGADVSARDSHHRKAIHLFCWHHSDPLAVKHLLEHGDKVNSLNSLRQSPLDLAIECSCDKCKATTQVLLEFNGTINSPVSSQGPKNHPELFEEGSSTPLAEYARGNTPSTVLSSDDGRSVRSSGLQSPGLDDSSSILDLESRSMSRLELETEQSNSSAKDSKLEDDVLSVGETSTLSEQSAGIRKRDRFKAKMRGIF